MQESGFGWYRARSMSGAVSTMPLTFLFGIKILTSCDGTVPTYQKIVELLTFQLEITP